MFLWLKRSTSLESGNEMSFPDSRQFDITKRDCLHMSTDNLSMEKYRLVQEQQQEIPEIPVRGILSTPSSPQAAFGVQQPESNRRESPMTSERKRLSSVPAQSDHADSSSGSTAWPPQVRITQQGKPRNYITYALNLLTVSLGCLCATASGFFVLQLVIAVSRCH
jgi:hypothetical protein